MIEKRFGFDGLGFRMGLELELELRGLDMGVTAGHPRRLPASLSCRGLFGVCGLGFVVCCLGFRFWVFKVLGVGSLFWGGGVQNLGFRVLGVGLRVLGVRFRV